MNPPLKLGILGSGKGSNYRAIQDAIDAGIVYLPKRKPYVIAILTEWEAETTGRSPTIAAASYMIYEYLTGGRDEGDD